MAKKPTTTPADDSDLNSLLGGLTQAKSGKSAKKPDYEVLTGYEKEVDEWIALKNKAEEIEATLESKKLFFQELGKKYNQDRKINGTVGFAGTNADDKALFVPTSKASSIVMVDDENKETEIVQSVRKCIPKDKFSRWFFMILTLTVKTDDEDRLAKFIKYNVDGGFGDMLIFKKLLQTTVEWFNEKLSSGLKPEIIAYIESFFKPVDQIKQGKKKKGE